MLPGNDQGSTSREKNSNGVFENNYVSNAHNVDTWPGIAKEGRAKRFTAQVRSCQPTKRPAPGQSKPKIREIDVEQEPEELGNDECHQ